MPMQLVTADIQATLNRNGTERGLDHRPALKLFAPTGPATWLITEMDPFDNDQLFGLADLGFRLSRTRLPEPVRNHRHPAPLRPRHRTRPPLSREAPAVDLHRGRARRRSHRRARAGPRGRGAPPRRTRCHRRLQLHRPRVGRAPPPLGHRSLIDASTLLRSHLPLPGNLHQLRLAHGRRVVRRALRRSQVRDVERRTHPCTG